MKQTLRSWNSTLSRTSFAPRRAPMPYPVTELPSGRKGLRPRSKRQQRIEAARKPVRAVYMQQHPYCEAAQAGAPRPCWGPLECHEPLTKARGGAQDDPQNMKSVCSEHNRLISQDVEVMRWALANGFLKHSWTVT